ncbi:hypothetical protein Vretifemale_15386 [Volvox reticuliferus]|uniref:Uncharacterized protein n=1 Tax=Volvox reticuliferus TaxID=1737510 RepID=A0A8J4FSM0_9CHLO|nr:hypothetical protein Vretifemale_15386 [Volvox reticuliferus]
MWSDAPIDPPALCAVINGFSEAATAHTASSWHIRLFSPAREALHTDGRVSDLWAAAMDGQYDSMYDAIPPFSFGHCLPYQDMENEWSMFRGTVVLDCAGTGRHWVPQEGSLLMWGRMQGSRELDGSGSSTTGDMSCGSSTTSSSDGDRSGRSTADGWCYIIHDGGVSIESAAVPLPAKYRLVTDVYSNSAARDSILLA